MALKFYSNVDLDQQQLENVSLEKVAQSGLATYKGRLIFTPNGGAAGTLSYYNGASGAGSWVNLDGTGDVDSVEGQSGITVTETSDVYAATPDYTSAVSGSVGNIVLSAGAGSTGNWTLGSKIMVSHADNSVEQITLTELQTQTASGVSSITATNTAGEFVDITTSTTSGVFTASSALSAGTPSDTSHFLKATSATTTAWAAWPTYNNNTYSFVTTGFGSAEAQYARVRLAEGGSGSGFTASLFFKPTTNQIITTPDASTPNNGIVTLGLSHTLALSATLETTTDFNPNSLSVTGNVTFSSNLDADSSTSSTFTAHPTINAVAGDYTLATQWANVNYVLSVADDFIIYKGGYDAANNSPDLDVSPSSLIEIGWAYVVTSPGNFFSEEVETGDMLIAITNSPTTLVEWNIVQNKVGLADNSVAGTALYSNSGPANGFASGMTPSEPKLAPHATTTVNGDPLKSVEITTDGFGMVTGVTAQTVLLPNAVITSTNPGIVDFNDDVQDLYEATVYDTTGPAAGSLTNPSMVVNHALTTRDVFVEVFDTTDSNSSIFADVVRTDTANITVSLTGTFTADQFKILVHKVV